MTKIIADMTSRKNENHLADSLNVVRFEKQLNDNRIVFDIYSLTNNYD